MIYPTRRAIVIALAGAPVVLAVGALRPGLWLIGAVWAAVALLLLLADAAMGADRRRVEARLEAPHGLAVGAPATAIARIAFLAGPAPGEIEARLETGERITVVPARVRAAVQDRAADAVFQLEPVRRGMAEIPRLWLRWTGPLGLVWKQVAVPLDIAEPILLDIGAVKQEAIRLFARDAPFGAKSQLETGEGSDYHALRDFQAGMDMRTIDWRRSARHGALLAKEFRTERNHHVIFAVDCGRLMSQPLAGPPRIDRALNAALLLAFVALKMGDRVGLYSFDERPRISTGVVSGAAAFPLLQRQAAQVDYSIAETNFTLGLTQLASELQRRSLVVVFTDFADSTSAELMMENVARLLRTHLVLFMAFRDEELESLVRAEPEAPDDVSRSVIAGTLLREREVVIGRLRRMGVQVVEAAADRIGPELLNAYLALKRKELV
ncbi:MAG TPA: DUF58 domain-containing protein [Caulobacteraceae bacterium]|nr:DUF58 domain-containing protein [Caulobacteraceae bacterium]